MKHKDLDQWMIKRGNYLREYEPEEFHKAKDFYRTLPDGSKITEEQLEAGQPADFWMWYILIWRRSIDGLSWGDI